MTYTKVKSSNIDAVKYDTDSQTLHIRFKNNKVYVYQNINQSLFHKFLSYPSKTAFLNEYIHNKYKLKKL